MCVIGCSCYYGADIPENFPNVLPGVKTLPVPGSEAECCYLFYAHLCYLLYLRGFWRFGCGL